MKWKSKVILLGENYFFDNIILYRLFIAHKNSRYFKILKNFDMHYLTCHFSIVGVNNFIKTSTLK